MRDEQLVVDVELVGGIEDIGKAAAAALPPGRRARYTQAVLYTLEDGTKIEGTERGLTKPKLKEAIERTRRYIQEKIMWRYESDYGGGFSIKFSIGGARL